jgi:multiple antibiotic resistance protein
MPRNSQGKAAVVGCIALLAATVTLAAAQEAIVDLGAQAPAAPFSLGKIFILLFLTLGPLKLLGPFAEITRGHDTAFKRRLAFESTIIAILALLVAVTLGARILQTWGISLGALQITAGIILFLIALQPVLEQYRPRELRAELPAATPAPTVSALAFSPLAFPTIVTPYGIAVLILLVALREGDITKVFLILGVTAVVLMLDLLAMLGTDRILKTPLIAPALGILGAVLGVLQVALGVQAVVGGLRLLGVL